MGLIFKLQELMFHWIYGSQLTVHLSYLNGLFKLYIIEIAGTKLIYRMKKFPNIIQDNIHSPLSFVFGHKTEANIMSPVAS